MGSRGAIPLHPNIHRSKSSGGKKTLLTRVISCVNVCVQLTDDKAIFVEALPGSELWRSGYSPFFTDAQFRHAVRLIRMPIQSFHRLAVQLQDPENVTFIGIIGCRGSTLLTQMFEHTGQVVAISEPPALEYLEEVLFKSRLEWGNITISVIDDI